MTTISLEDDLAFRICPGGELFRRAGMSPDPWQLELFVEQPRRALLLMSRQSGKTTATAALAAGKAWTEPGSLILGIAPSQRQAALLIDRVRSFLPYLPDGGEVTQESTLALRLPNGSRIIALPALEQTIRGYSPTLVIFDEAAFVPDGIWETVRPMLAASNGGLLLLSTPNGRRGFYYRSWVSTEPWRRFKVTADMCPRISAEFLEEERRELPAARFAAEYEGVFGQVNGAAFLASNIEAAFVTELPGGERDSFPTFGQWSRGRR